MKESDVIEAIKDFVSKRFPKSCSTWGKRYETLAQYLTETTHSGKSLSHDTEIGNWLPLKPIGTISISYCSCGSSLAISSQKQMAGQFINTQNCL